MLGLKNTINDLKGWSPLEYLWYALAVSIGLGLCVYWGDTPIGMISMVTNIMCVVLVAKRKISNYFWGLIGVVTYAYVSYSSKLYGDFMLNAFYFLPMQFIGYKMWMKNMNKGEVERKYLSKEQKILGVITAMGLICVYHIFLVALKGNATLLDATSTVLSVIAMGLLAKGYAEQWHLWIMVNLASIGMWIQVAIIGEGSVSALVMWCMFTCNSFFGFYRWKRDDNFIKNKECGKLNV